MSTLLPRLPRPFALAAGRLPLRPLTLGLGLVVRQAARTHPALYRRLGHHAGQRFLIDLADLPFTLLLEPAPPALTAHRRSHPPAHDARLSGSLSAFLAMLHGAEDGDALFFAGELTIEGDTEAVLALRNALDDAELDLTDELAAAAGAFGGLLRWLTGQAERLTGLALRRSRPRGPGA